MATDPEQLSVVREALQAADGVDARAVDVVADDDVIVLRGSVATFEQASAAVGVAEQHADAVRNELRVDTNLREGVDAADEPAPRSAEALTGSSYNPVEQPDELVTDMQHALEENVAWDPPHEAVEVPTRAEERGVGDRSGSGDDGGDTLLDDTADPGAKSLPDVSPEELARAAHPEPADEETA